LSMERDEMTDTVIASHVDATRRRGVGLCRYPADKYRYLVAKNTDDEGFFLIWEGAGKNTDFDEDVYEKAKQVLVEQLRNRGFAKAQVRGRVEVAPEEGAAHIVFQVDPGKRYTFGDVNVSGNHRVPTDAITHATGIDRGDQYSPQAIALAQQAEERVEQFLGARDLGAQGAQPPEVSVLLGVHGSRVAQEEPAGLARGEGARGGRGRRAAGAARPRSPRHRRPLARRRRRRRSG